MRLAKMVVVANNLKLLARMAEAVEVVVVVAVAIIAATTTTRVTRRKRLSSARRRARVRCQVMVTMRSLNVPIST